MSAAPYLCRIPRLTIHTYYHETGRFISRHGHITRNEPQMLGRCKGALMVATGIALVTQKSREFFRRRLDGAKS